MKNQNIRSILIGLLVILGLYLVIDHGQHLAPYFPFTFLLGCLFMHVFMHKGHGGHGGDGGRNHQGHEGHEQPK
jgi:Protein of unknown function (DUF2933)